MTKKVSKVKKEVTLIEENPSADFVADAFLQALETTLSTGNPSTMELGTDVGTLKVMIVLETHDSLQQ